MKSNSLRKVLAVLAKKSEYWLRTRGTWVILKSGKQICTILSNPVSRFNCVLAIPRVVPAESITAMSRAYGHTTYEWYVIGMDIIL
ncbi:hypothetical protein F2Q70_00021800 [Brassica cretica]|uniref:Uncharacterized protein n=1 Tax=Brassica cretica TaxID=69181 RepID=A0A8S9GN93_BRACR|nr:hypothetical protein F2Q70_00021800 [Brassica cretica]